ncbi:MAG: alpha/beta hydrolase [Myxococcota bacterium]
MAQHDIDIRGTRWRVHVSGSGPAVLLVHGTGSSGHSFAPLIPCLREHLGPRTFVVPDLPGHRESGALAEAGPALPAFSAGLADVLRHLELSPELAVGHSAGAAVVASMTLASGLDAALYVGVAPAFVPFPRLQQEAGKLSARWLAPLSTRLARLAGLGASAASTLADVLGVEAFSRLPREQRDAYAELVGSPPHLEGVLTMLSRWDVGPVYRALSRLPGRWLLVAGKADTAVPVGQVRRAARRISRAQLSVKPGGHVFHEQDPDPLAQEIAQELKKSIDRM